jgi:hypothetical protein
MKIVVSLLCLLSFALAGAGLADEPKTKPAEERTIDILFIGNSFTAWNELPQLVKAVFEEGQPGLTVNTEQVIGGGQNLFTHWTYFKSPTFLEMSTVTGETIRQRIAEIEEIKALEELPEAYANYSASLGKATQLPPLQNFQNVLHWSGKRLERLLDWNPRTKWDYVVLQSWMDEVTDPDKGYAKWATEFADLASEHDTQVILYLTAPFVQNPVPAERPRLQQQVDLQMQVARDLANAIDADAVVPVPLAINTIQQGETGLTFCFENDFHPNQTSSFLTANLFYAAVFDESPEGFEFNTVTCTKVDDDGKDPDGGDATVVFDEETKTYLQRVAFEVVRAFDESLASQAAAE